MEKHHLEIKRDDPSSLLCLGETCLYFGVKVWAPHMMRSKELLEGVQQIATNLNRELGHFSYEEMLRELRLFSLEKAQHRPYKCI